MVIDNSGKTVGTLFDCCSVVVHVASPGAPGGEDLVMLPVSPSGFVQSSAPVFYYQDASCATTPYMRKSGMFSETVVSGSVAYYASAFQPQDPLHPIVAQTWSGSCFGTSFSGQIGQALPVDISVFTPPFVSR